MKDLQKAAVNPSPGPIPLSQQYKKSFADVNDDDDDDDAAAVKGNTKTKKKKNKVKKPTKPKKSKATPAKAKPFSFKPSPAKSTVAVASSCDDTAKHVQQEGDAYCPHRFAEQSKIFLQAKIAEGCSYRDAQKLWVKSAERASYLARVPLPELKRRKFVPKGVQENPFKAAIGGA